jgi:hypothetical protein
MAKERFRGSRLWIVAGMLVLACGPGAAVSHAADGAIGQWRFDEGVGQVAFDDGPFALDGRLGAQPGADAGDPQRIPGASGGALRFDGTQFVRLPQAGELQPARLTVEAVVRGDTAPGPFRYVLSQGADACFAGSYGLYTGGADGMAFYVYDGSRFVVSPTAAPEDVWNGRWHHVAGVFDGSTLRLYVDGRPVGDPTPAPLSIAYALTSTDAYIGIYQGSCRLALRGDVDLVREWAQPLDGGAIAALADAALASPAITPPSGADPGAVPAAPPPGGPERPPLTPAAPGGPIVATQPAGGADAVPAAGRGGPVVARACVVRSSPSRLRAKAAAVVSVRVALRKRALRKTRVLATTGAGKTIRVLARGRTRSDGRVRLKLRVPSRGTVHLRVPDRRECAALALKVTRRR